MDKDYRNKVENEKAYRTDVFTQNLQDAMEFAKINQEQLAERMGVTQPFISRMMTGHVMPSFPTAIKLHVALGMTFPRLFQE